ncbi:hypothetical protein GCM10011492_11280 [Flexivirga endophytica]|uniref:Uncharacterized protein n=1 Tax=Flexivirga endophytica TaxID=1849103 RepID=A0A916WRB0_9MICO|nr:hypothetical protein GCM10011492_11280 [Flexivirga endophytica]GHB57089.1 hypothetical protein GCM10008112_27820 [Flexivirga endophytica]
MPRVPWHPPMSPYSFPEEGGCTSTDYAGAPESVKDASVEYGWVYESYVTHVTGEYLRGWRSWSGPVLQFQRNRARITCV